MSPDVVCVQLGAREHYAVPRCFAGSGRLRALITDYWSRGLWTLLPSTALAQRVEPGIPGERVRSANAWMLVGESRSAGRRRSWDAILSRNIRFGRWAASQLKKLGARRRPAVVVAYSYAALELVQACRDLEIPLVLGQIDGGAVEAQKVAEERERYPDLADTDDLPPPAYWRRWREELGGADRIVVNSCWSRQLLVEAGVESERLETIPLIFDSAFRAPGRRWPARFDRQRPLRCLFLGSVILRKGVGRLFEAIQKLSDAPVTFDFVGPVGVRVPTALRRDPRVAFHGLVPRSRIWNWYREADLFLFPTVSDGFGLTQLEAMATGLPVLASRSCGEVVMEDENGRLLEDNAPEQWVAGIEAVLESPHRLATWSDGAARTGERFSRSAIEPRWLDLADRMGEPMTTAATG